MLNCLELLHKLLAIFLKDRQVCLFACFFFIFFVFLIGDVRIDIVVKIFADLSHWAILQGVRNFAFLKIDIVYVLQ